MIPWTIALGQATSSTPSWHYGGWFAVDLRLLLFILFISALTAAGTTALFSRGKTSAQLLALYLVSWVAIVTLSIVLFNQIASYPVFTLKSFFPMP
jgi:hypothetical protein